MAFELTSDQLDRIARQSAATTVLYLGHIASIERKSKKGRATLQGVSIWISLASKKTRLRDWCATIQSIIIEYFRGIRFSLNYTQNGLDHIRTQTFKCWVALSSHCTSCHQCQQVISKYFVIYHCKEVLSTDTIRLWL